MTTKYTVLVLIVSAFSISSFAQNVAINTTGNPASASAILDISSQDKGILIPRMTTSERLAISNPAQGLMAFDTNTRSFWFYSNGWNEISSGGVSGSAGGDLSGFYPFPSVVKIQNLNVATGTPLDKQVLKWDAASNNWKGRNDSLFLPYTASLSNSGALVSVTNTNTAQGATALYGRRGAGSGLSPGVTMGVWGDNANNLGVLGSSDTGIGVYGFANFNYGVYGYSTTAGYAGVKGSHANSGGIGVMGEIQVGGTAVLGSATGASGKAGSFISSNASHNDTSFIASTAGLGMLSTFNVSNATNGSTAVGVSDAGTGTGLSILMSNTSANAYGIDATVKGIGIAGKFIIDNAVSENTALYSTTIGNGCAAYFVKNNTSGSINDPHLAAVIIDNNSKGSALNIQSLHSPSVNSAVYVNYGGDAYGLDVHSTSKGIHAIAAGEHAMLVENSGGGTGIEATTAGAGTPAMLGTNNNYSGVGVKGAAMASQGTGVLGVGGAGDDYCIGVKGISSSSLSYIGSVTGVNNSTGVAVYGQSENGTGVSGVSGSYTHFGVYGYNNGGGNGVYGFSSGGISACGVDGTADSDDFGVGVRGSNFGHGDGVAGNAGIDGNGVSGGDGAEGMGRAGYFDIFHTSNSHEAVRMNNHGTGVTLYVQSYNASSSADLAVFQKNSTGNYAIFKNGAGTNLIRFDSAGKGYFNGGTQTGGADMAEAFDVEEDIATYSPGDVLVISTNADRTVVKSTEPYSALVAGVYATKPGVLMTEETIDTDLSDKVPMGVVGVIPTKVCLEGGAISRGDLLVTSSVPGVAMKGDLHKILPGQVLGKALENYESDTVGLIRVLVSVR